MKEQKSKNIKFSVVWMFIIIAVFFIGYVEGLSKQTLFNQSVSNYYNITYGITRQGVRFDIQNINGSCIVIAKSEGSSMKPFFENKDLIIVDSCFQKDKLQEGNTIIYSDENETIMHRIVYISYKRERVKTKGDWNIKQDEGYISFDDIIGKAIGFINY